MNTRSPAFTCSAFPRNTHYSPPTVYSPCVKQSVQTKINPSPFTIQVCKVMDAASGESQWSVQEREREERRRRRKESCPLLSFNSPAKAERGRNLTSQSPCSPTPASLRSSLGDARAQCVCEERQRESSERGSQTSRQAVSERSSQSGRGMGEEEKWVMGLNKWMSSSVFSSRLSADGRRERTSLPLKKKFKKKNNNWFFYRWSKHINQD